MGSGVYGFREYNKVQAAECISAKLKAAIFNDESSENDTLCVRVICSLTLPPTVSKLDDLSMEVCLKSARDVPGEFQTIFDANFRDTRRTCVLQQGETNIKTETTYLLRAADIPGDKVVPQVTLFFAHRKIWRYPLPYQAEDISDASLVLPAIYGTLAPTRLKERVNYRGLKPNVPCRLTLNVHLMDLSGNDLGVLLEDGAIQLVSEDPDERMPLTVSKEFVPSEPSGTIDVEIESPTHFPLGAQYVGNVTIEQDGRCIQCALPAMKSGIGIRMVSFLVTPQQEHYIRHGGPRNKGSAHLRNLIRREINGETSRVLIMRGHIGRKEGCPLTLQMPLDLKNAFRARSLGLGISQNELIRALIDADMANPDEVPWVD